MASATRRAFLRQVLAGSATAGLGGCGPAARGVATGRSADGQRGLRWQQLAQAPTSKGKQDDLFFIDAQRGWSVNGKAGSIFHTGDGGQTWERQLQKEGTYFRCVLFTSPLRGFAGNIGTGYFPEVTDPTPLYQTYDGGQTWAAVTRISGPPPRGLCNLHALQGDPRQLFAVGRVGSPCFFLRSSDGGETWTARDLSAQMGMLIDVHFRSEREGLLFGCDSTDENTGRCLILATADGGDTWERRYVSGQPREMCWKVAFPTPEVGYAAVLGWGEQSSFLKTRDGGRTWQQRPLLPGRYEAKGIGFVTPELGWVGGEKPGRPAYRTSDGGDTWTRDDSLGPYINRFRFLGGAGYAIGSAIYKLAPAS